MAPLARLALVAAYLAAFAVGAPTSNSLALDEDKPNCHSGVYMVVTRGSEEPPGEGRCAEVAQIVKAALPNAASTAVPYPATTANPPYNDSVVKGIKSLKHIVESYVDHCGPKSRVALVGYSQGGQVSTDALVGGDTPAALDQKYHKHITAVTVFGDPTFTAGEPFDRGNATTSGIFTRQGQTLAHLKSHSHKVRSYCMANDPVCASGGDLNVHLDEVEQFAHDAAHFIIQMNK